MKPVWEIYSHFTRLSQIVCVNAVLKNLLMILLQLYRICSSCWGYFFLFCVGTNNKYDTWQVSYVRQEILTLLENLISPINQTHVVPSSIPNFVHVGTNLQLGNDFGLLMWIIWMGLQCCWIGIYSNTIFLCLFWFTWFEHETSFNYI